MAVCLTSLNNIAVTGKLTSIDIYNFNEELHEIIDLPKAVPECSDDQIIHITTSPNEKYIAILTSISKRLLIYDLSSAKFVKTFALARAASKVRFSPDSDQILVADKTGDAISYYLNTTDTEGVKLFGHLSLLLDILMSSDSEHIVTCDRDEKIRVTCYPNTHIIHSYCLGHKEFVNNIELLPNDDNYLVSTSGDGTVRIWEFKTGRQCHKIDTNSLVNIDKNLQEFIQSMDKDAVEVTALPIVRFAICKIDETSCLLAFTLHRVNCIILLKVSKNEQTFNHNAIHRIETKDLPSDIVLKDQHLLVCFENEQLTYLEKYYIEVKDNIQTKMVASVNLFQNCNIQQAKGKADSINIMYKRKFDNIQDYLERKRQRINE